MDLLLGLVRQVASSTFRSKWSGVYMLMGSTPRLIVNSPTWRGFQYLQNSSKILLCVPIRGERAPCPNATLDCFSLVSNPLPSLINKCLNLPIGTQQRAWGLNEGCLLKSKKWGTQKVFVPQSPTAPCLVSLLPLGI